MDNIVYIIGVIVLTSIISCTYDLSYIVPIKLKQLYNLHFEQTISNFYYYNVNPDPNIGIYYKEFTFYIIILLLPFLCLMNLKYKKYSNQNSICILFNFLFCIVLLRIYFSYMMDTIIKVPHIKELNKY